MKLFHKSLTACALAGIAQINLAVTSSGNAQEAASPRFSALFDPAKGFKPAQPNLTEIFLQIAGSLEATGSPEGYIRHMQAEHKRVSALWKKSLGKELASRMPPHLTDEYLERLIKNWNLLSKPLGLDAFAKDIGHCVRDGIIGTRDTGTIAVAVFNSHQERVAATMSGKLAAPVGFENLRSRIQRELEFDREKLDTTGYSVDRRDAVDYASIIDGKFKKQLRKIDGLVKPEKKAASIERSLVEWFLDLGYLAQTELELSILEYSASR